MERRNNIENIVAERYKEKQELQYVKHTGTRGPSFKNLINKILMFGQVPDDKRLILLNDSNMKLFDIAFTHSSFSDKNYEYYEIIGDQIVNTSIVKFIVNKFPQLKNPQGVKFIARLRINLVSRKILSDMAQKLGFWDFISSDMFIRKTKMKPLLEDCFEAFIGVIWSIYEEQIQKDGGYRYCYNIIDDLLQNTSISLEYEDLYDAKSRLKELFDTIENKTLNYRVLKRPPEHEQFEVAVEAIIPIYTFKCLDENKTFNGFLIKTDIPVCPTNHSHKLDEDIRVKSENKIWGIGRGHLLKTAKQNASEEAWKKLKTMNISK